MKRLLSQAVLLSSVGLGATTAQAVNLDNILQNVVNVASAMGVVQSAPTQTTSASTTNNGGIWSLPPASAKASPLAFERESSDTALARNPYQLAFFAMAYLADHDPAKLTGANIYKMLIQAVDRRPLELIGSDDQSLRNLEALISRYKNESDVFNRQEKEQQIQQIIQAYYAPYRGYKKIAYTEGYGSRSVQHYNMATRSFKVGYDSSTDCDIDQQAWKTITKVLSPVFAVPTKTPTLDYNACQAVVTDERLAREIENYVTTLSVDRYKFIQANIQIQAVPSANGVAIQPLNEYLQFKNPETNKVIYSKPILAGR